MFKSAIFILAAICSMMFIGSTFSFASEQINEQVGNDQKVKVVQVVFIDDENEPEFLAILDNHLRLLCKWHDGVLFAGQDVGIEFSDEGFQIHLTTYGKEGEIRGEMNLYRMGDDPRFYQAL